MLLVPQIKLGRTKFNFCNLKFRLWGPNTFGPPKSPKIYAFMSMISFVAIYALLGGPALTINSWLGDQNQFIQPGTLE